MRCTAAVVMSVVVAGVLPATAGADVISVVSSRDNTLYQDATGSLSNGAGPGFFAGATASVSVRRGVVGFDLSAIPAGAVVTDAALTLHMSSAGATPADIALYRVLTNWGEGTSNAGASGGGGAPATAGDATWLHTFSPGSFWATPGGDFAPGASATQSVAGVASYTWDGAGLIADVQGWVVSPGSNFGWLLRGDEGAASTTKRFDSREHGTPAFRPVLSVTYTIPAPGGAAVLAAGAALLATRRRRR